MASSVARLLVIMILVQFAVLAYVYVSFDQTRNAQVTSQREECERGKLDRRANARFQRAQRDYIGKVTRAVSVKEDVKVAAREARKTFIDTASELTHRSKINCKEVFP